MKILELNLIAFGPFTDCHLDLSGGDAGFHVIYGPNEAGKSSALRALLQMLYGIPVRSADDFVHPYGKLRIGGRLGHGDGTEIAFVRRKGQTKTLRAADDDSPLDAAALSPFLGNVGESLFRQMFGIGHEALVRGGREIVSGGGKLGQTLFAAGSGLLQLRSVQNALMSECEGLFKPTAKKLPINLTLSTIKETRRSQREAELSGATWRKHEKALRDAQDRIGIVRRETEKRRQEESRLSRIREALPLISKRKDIRQALLAYVDAPLLPEGFGDKRLEAVTAFRAAIKDRDGTRETIDEIKHQIERLSVPDAILAEALKIEDLQQELGSYTKAAVDRPNLETRMRLLRSDAAALLSTIDDSLDLESARRLRLSPARVGDIQELGKTYERLNARLEAARENERKLSVRLKTLTDKKRALKTPLETTALTAVLEEAVSSGPLEARYEDEIEALKELDHTIAIRLKRQTVWEGAAGSLEGLPCPSGESIESFKEKFSLTRQRWEGLQADKARIETELARVESELRAIELTQAVPTEAELGDARRQRDLGWLLVRNNLEDGIPDPAALERFTGLFGGASTLADAFKVSIDRVDEISDRLRREADRVNRNAALVADREQSQKRLENIRESLATAVSDRERLQDGWRQLWAPAGISPLSPKEMRSWAADIRELKERAAESRRRAAAAEHLKGTIGRFKKDFVSALSRFDTASDARSERLSDSISTARRIVEEQARLRSLVESLTEEIHGWEGEMTETQALIETLENALTEWREKWSRAVSPLGIDAQSTPTVAHTVIDSMRDMAQKIAEADILQKRIHGMDRDGAAFKKKVADLAAALLPDGVHDAPERMARELYARLTAAREARSKIGALEEHLLKEEKSFRDADRRIAELKGELEALCQEAGSARVEDLPEIERQAQARQRFESKLAELEDRLRMLSAGAALDEFIHDATTVDADRIDPALETLTREMVELNREMSDLDQAIGREKTELRRMDGSARAAELAEEAEQLLARLESDVEQYSRLKIASAVLAGAIEQFREKNQGPLLNRAGTIFSRMTLGAFSGIRAEYDDAGTPILVGTRPKATEPVKVEGMSDGSADQLYLSLRLAALEAFLEKNEPLPFVNDDVLIHFDNERAGATLGLLAELSRKTQVIFFTHHRHLVDLAETHVAAADLFVHDLN